MEVAWLSICCLSSVAGLKPDVTPLRQVIGPYVSVIYVLPAAKTEFKCVPDSFTKEPTGESCDEYQLD
jgi:hypothetical protein